MKNISSTLVLITLLLGCTSAFGQETNIIERPKNNIFNSLFQDESIKSISYERLFYTEENHFIALKIGVGGLVK